MPTAIIGVGNIGKAIASHLTDGGETVVLAASKPAQAEQLARDLGALSSAAGVADAIDQADPVIFAVWLDVPDGRPEGDPKRRALALAGDDQQAKQLVARLYNEFGFDAVDISGLDESWRVDVGQPAFVTRQNVAELTANVAKAERGLDAGLTPVPDA
jgi:predicted dinucleotide-binding enzyme